MDVNETLKSLCITLPESIISRLNSHFSSQEEQGFCLRALDYEEILELFQYISSIHVFKNILPLWADDNSNYIGLYYDGPLSYKVCYINHEETDISPGFRNVESFIRELEKNPDYDWFDLRKDYPAECNINNEWIEDDLKSIDGINSILEDASIDDDQRCQYLLSIMALTPYQHLNMLLGYLDDEDMYVQERACEILGYHRYEPASEKLQEVLNHGTHNGKLAAKIALSKINKVN